MTNTTYLKNNMTNKTCLFFKFLIKSLLVSIAIIFSIMYGMYIIGILLETYIITNRNPIDEVWGYFFLGLTFTVVFGVVLMMVAAILSPVVIPVFEMYYNKYKEELTNIKDV